MVVLSLAIISSMLLATMNYIPVEATQKNIAVNSLEGAFVSFEKGVGRYLTAQKTLVNELNPAEGYYIPYPGDGVSLNTAVSPTYVFEPKALNNMEWAVSTMKMGTINSVAICLKPKLNSTLTPLELSTLAIVQTKFVPGAITLGSDCGVASEAVKTHATLWVPFTHYE